MSIRVSGVVFYGIVGFDPCVGCWFFVADGFVVAPGDGRPATLLSGVFGGGFG